MLVPYQATMYAILQSTSSRRAIQTQCHMKGKCCNFEGRQPFRTHTPDKVCRSRPAPHTEICKVVRLIVTSPRSQSRSLSWLQRRTRSWLEERQDMIIVVHDAIKIVCWVKSHCLTIHPRALLNVTRSWVTPQRVCQILICCLVRNPEFVAVIGKVR